MLLAQDIISLAAGKSALLATAESCTGGMIAAALTDIAGSSVAVDRGFVTYSNNAKSELLGISPDMITSHGAVSSEVVAAMAEGAAMRITPSPHAIAVSVSGIAGPRGGSAAKPVGYVWFGLAHRHTQHHKDAMDISTMVMQFDGNRAQIRDAATHHALNMIAEKLSEI